jgi:hypothetical protein
MAGLWRMEATGNALLELGMGNVDGPFCGRSDAVAAMSNALFHILDSATLLARCAGSMGWAGELADEITAYLDPISGEFWPTADQGAGPEIDFDSAEAEVRVRIYPVKH